MKKRYIKPEIENIEITISCVCNSPDNTNLSTGDGQGSEGDNSDFTEDAGAARGDWDNIWGS